MKIRILTALTVFTILAPSARAEGDVPGPGEAPQGDPSPADVPAGADPTAPPLSGTAQARARDAAVDRGFLTTRAETIGKEQWAINAYELFFLGLTYGFTDDIQASLSFLMPLTTDVPLVLAVQPKFVVMRTPRTVLAVRTPLTMISKGGSSVGTFGAGLAVDHRFDPAGRYAIHGGVAVMGAWGEGLPGIRGIKIGKGAIYQLDFGASFAFADFVSLVLEASYFAASTPTTGFESLFRGVVFTYGVRFHSGSIAGDLGFIRPIGDADLEGLVMGVPYLAFSARF